MTFAQGNGPMVGFSCSLQSHGTQVSIFCRFQEVRFDHVKKRKEKLFNSDKPSGQSPIGSQFSCFAYSVEDSTMQYSNSTLSRSCD